jgi:hypothetical protein
VGASDAEVLDIAAEVAARRDDPSEGYGGQFLSNFQFLDAHLVTEGSGGIVLVLRSNRSGKLVRARFSRSSIDDAIEDNFLTSAGRIRGVANYVMGLLEETFETIPSDTIGEVWLD